MRRIEELLEHREWLRDLSRRLVADANLADDLVQKTWLAAVERPPQHTDRPRAWLATVMRNWLRRGWRDDATKRRHETAAAKPERIAGPDEMVARAEEMRRVVDAVLALDEPYRTTLLYRHHEGLAPRHIAERMGVPVETVRTRVKRGLAQVRAQLDAEHGGDGRTWALALLPLANMPIPTPVGGTPPGGAPDAGAAIGDLLGGLAVKTTVSKTAVAIGLLLLLLFAGGTALVLVPGDGGRTDGDLVAEVGDADGGVHEGTGDDVPGPAETVPAPTPDAPAETGGGTHALRISILGADGEPLAGARVELHPKQDIFPLSGAWEQGEAMLRGVTPVATGTTDADGALRVDLPGRGPWTMITRAAGHTTGYRWGVTGHRHDAEKVDEALVEQLQPGYSIRGRIVDQGRDPVANLPLIASPVQGGDREILGSRGSTERDGSFVLDGLPAGEAFIHTGAVQLVRLRIPILSEVVLRLAGHAISGTVTHAETGRPIEGVLVIAQPNGGSGGLVRATTDASGRYALNTLVPGPVVSMRLAKAGLTDTRENDYIPGGVGIGADGRGEMDFTMTEGATLTGSVTADGAPVADMGVAVVGTNWRPYVTRTGADGSFVLDGLPAGRAAVILECLGTEFHQSGLPRQWLSRLARGEAIGEWEVALELGENAHFDAMLSRGVAVSGIVRLPDGSPAEGATVHVNGRRSEPTDAHGRFRSEGVRPSDYCVATASLGELVANERVTVAHGQDVDGVELVLEHPVETTISGRVVDAAGESVAGAVVQLIDADRSASSRDPWASATRAMVAAGRYEVSTFIKGGVSLRALAPGFSPSATLSLSVEAGATLTDVVLTLERAPSIRGVARTSEGVAIAGAQVSLIEGGPRSDYRTMRTLTTAATTDAQGRFELADVLPGTWTLIVDAPHIVRWMEGIEVAEDHDLVATCERAHSITGTLRLASGEPITGISVTARKTGARPDEPGSHASAACAPNGRFELKGLPEGEYELSTFAFPGAATSLARTKVTGIAAGTTDLEIEVQVAGQITGTVLDADGKPLANARIQGFSESGDRYTPSCSSSADGTFALNGLAPTKGPYSLRVRPPDPQRFRTCEILDRHTGMQLTGVHVGTKGVEARLPLGRVIEGTLVGADGAPLANVWVKAECVTHDDVESWERTWYQGPVAQADADGRFRIRGLPDAGFALFLIPDPMRQTVGRATPLAGAERVRAGSSGDSYAAAETGAIEGRVVDEQDQAVAGVRVSAQPAGDASRSAVVSVKTGADGAFVLQGVVVERDYELSVRAKDLVPWKRTGVRTGGARVRIELSSGASIAGRLEIGGAAPSAPHFIKLFHEDSDFETGFATADDGTFEKKALPPGTYRVEVQTNPGKWPAEMQEIGTVATGTTDAVLRLE